jgi:hypothetical protein
MMIVVSHAIAMMDLELLDIGLGFEEGGASRSPRLGWAPINAGAVKSVTKYNGITSSRSEPERRRRVL